MIQHRALCLGATIIPRRDLFGLAIVVIAVLSSCASSPRTSQRYSRDQLARQSEITLDGVRMRVNWNDGDSFSVSKKVVTRLLNSGHRVFGGQSSRPSRVRARLQGYNALESYGPVHVWGKWHARDLYFVAKKASEVARAKVWSCQRIPGGSGGYGRILVNCPELRETLLSSGLAHVFAVDYDAPAADLAAQARAISQRRGIWAKGVPTGLVTSVHSADERSQKGSYNRVCSTADGKAVAVPHNSVYCECEQVCASGSCMTYVPFKRRYGKNRANCLR